MIRRGTEEDREQLSLTMLVVQVVGLVTVGIHKTFLPHRPPAPNHVS